MNTFLLHLQSATQYERIENVLSFVGEDDSGSFGILPGHARMMTLLGFGLARFRVTDQDWEFLALPGALAYFVDDQLYLNTRRYLRGKDYERLSAAAAEGIARRRRSLARNETEHAPPGRRNVQALVENEAERRMVRMKTPDDSRSAQKKLEEQVAKQARRMKQAEKERRGLVSQSVYLGTLGLMFVLPVVAGAYLGQWLDNLSKGYEVQWTVSLIVLGVVVGGINVYFFIRE